VPDLNIDPRAVARYLLRGGVYGLGGGGAVRGVLLGFHPLHVSYTKTYEYYGLLRHIIFNVCIYILHDI
jgi:hypothetical protein